MMTLIMMMGLTLDFFSLFSAFCIAFRCHHLCFARFSIHQSTVVEWGCSVTLLHYLCRCSFSPFSSAKIKHFFFRVSEIELKWFIIHENLNEFFTMKFTCTFAKLFHFHRIPIRFHLCPIENISVTLFLLRRNEFLNMVEKKTHTQLTHTVTKKTIPLYSFG